MIHNLLFAVFFLTFTLCTFAQDAQKCYQCHDTKRQEVAEGRHDHLVHVKAQLTCITCHGDDEIDQRGRHTEKEGFKGRKWEGVHFPTFCGTCHTQIRDDFERGPHGAATHANKKIGKMAEGMRGCVGCHDFRRDSPLVYEAPPRHRNLREYCVQCHDPSSSGLAKGQDMAEFFDKYEDRLWQTRRNIDRLAAVPGVDPTGDRLTFEEAHRRFHRMKSIQHSMNAGELLTASREVDLQVGKVSASLGQKKSSLEQRKWWLFAFLLLLAVNGTVIYIKFKRIMAR